MQWRRQGGKAPPPSELKDHPCEKIRGEIEGGERWLYLILKLRSFSAKSHSENAGNRICGTPGPP